MKIEMTYDLMTEKEFLFLLDTYNYLEGCPKSYDEVVEDSKNIYDCYQWRFKNFGATLKMFKLMVWDILEYYEDDPMCEEFQVAKKFLKETYLYY